MCDFLSAIVLKNGDIICDPEHTDSHLVLIDSANIRDTRIDPEGFVKVGFLPPEYSGKSIFNTKNWSLKVDQQTTPEWFNHDRIRSRLADKVERMFVLEDRKILLGGCWILGGETVVKKAMNARIFRMLNLSEVDILHGSSSVDEMYASSKINEMYNSSGINKMFDSSKVNRMYGTSKIDEMYGLSKVDMLWNSSSINVMFDSSKIVRMYCLSSINMMFDSSRVDRMFGSSSINEMYDSSQINKMLDSSKVDIMYHSSKVGEMFDSSEILQNFRKE